MLRHLGDVQRHSARGERDSGGIASLTRREREIAELVWDRRTNREIAETLFLSAKTVESHLRNIFAKTARQLTRRARPRGRASPFAGRRSALVAAEGVRDRGALGDPERLA